MTGEKLPAAQDPNRKTDGTFAAGHKLGVNANPSGNNGNEKGFQKAATRFRHYLEMPVAEVKALSENDAELAKMPTRDMLIIATLAAGSKQTKEGLKNRQEAFDRAYGKSTQMLGTDPENPFISPLPEKFPSVEEAAARYLAETKARPA